MMEADFSMTQHAMGNSNYGDERLAVKFEMFPKPDQEASDKEGRPIYREVEFITIMVPGDKHSIVKREVWAQDKLRFSRQYQAFRDGRSQDVVGTPLASCTFITRAQVEEMAFFHIRTVEQLAAMADVHAQKFMGIHKLRQQARDFLAAAKDSAVLTEMRGELEKRDAQSAAQEAAIKEQGAVIAKLQAKLELLTETTED